MKEFAIIATAVRRFGNMTIRISNERTGRLLTSAAVVRMSALQIRTPARAVKLYRPALSRAQSQIETLSRPE
jgi:hypothetical protein